MTKNLDRGELAIWGAVMRADRPRPTPSYSLVTNRMKFPGPWTRPEARLDEMERIARENLRKKMPMANVWRRVSQPVRVPMPLIVRPGDPAFATGRLLGPDGQPLGG